MQTAYTLSWDVYNQSTSIMIYSEQPDIAGTMERSEHRSENDNNNKSLFIKGFIKPL